jgi:hypothetical protein
VRFRESCSSVVGEIDYLLAVTEVGVSDCGIFNVDHREL